MSQNAARVHNEATVLMAHLHLERAYTREAIEYVRPAQDLADRLKIPVAKVRLLLEAQKTPYSLEMKVGDDQGTELGEMLPDLSVRSPEDTAINGDVANEVERALAPLSDRERKVLSLRYGLGTDREYTLEEIGRHMSVTRERIRQIESRALQKLRATKQREAAESGGRRRPA